jgi:integration host factor subunit beta
MPSPEFMVDMDFKQSFIILFVSLSVLHTPLTHARDSIRTERAFGVNKSDLIQLISRELKLPIRKAEEVVDKFFVTISQGLVSGNRIEIRGFGTFESRDYKEYRGRNPKTGEEIGVLSKRLPFFKPGKELRRLLMEAPTGSGPVKVFDTLASEPATPGTERRQPSRLQLVEKVHEQVSKKKTRLQTVGKKSPHYLDKSREELAKPVDAIRATCPTVPAQPQPRDVTDLIERSLDVEHLLKIDLLGIHARITPRGQLIVNGEIKISRPKRLPPNLNLIITFHDVADRVLHVAQEKIDVAGVPGSQLFSIEWTLPDDMTDNPPISKIRIQPGISSEGIANIPRRGVFKRICEWIRRCFG